MYSGGTLLDVTKTAVVSHSKTSFIALISVSELKLFTKTEALEILYILVTKTATIGTEARSFRQISEPLGIVSADREVKRELA
jgi:hypothetical protein